MNSSKIKRLRTSKGFSQAELAVKLKITQASFARLESGKIKMTVKRMEQLGEILDVHPSYFLNDKEEDPVSFDRQITNEYLKTLVETNKKLRDEISELYKNQITDLRQQNGLLIKLLEAKNG